MYIINPFLFIWEHLFNTHAIISHTTQQTLISRTLMARQFQKRPGGEDPRKMNWKESDIETIKKHLCISNEIRKLLEIHNTSLVTEYPLEIVVSCLSAGGLLDEWSI
jgi:hypothetical protein